MTLVDRMNSSSTTESPSSIWPSFIRLKSIYRNNMGLDNELLISQSGGICPYCKIFFYADGVRYAHGMWVYFNRVVNSLNS